MSDATTELISVDDFHQTAEAIISEVGQVIVGHRAKS